MNKIYIGISTELLHKYEVILDPTHSFISMQERDNAKEVFFALGQDAENLFEEFKYEPFVNITEFCRKLLLHLESGGAISL